jgi:ketosteroid isomerase-like protein
MTSQPREALLSTVARSPTCVAAHDRAGWLDLFTDDAVVEDPVGSAPAPKAGGVLGRFFDTFIAPHDIRFEILHDHVLGNDVFRDAIIHTRVRDGVEVKVEAYLLYQVEARDGALRVRRMAAYWTLARMTSIAMGMGPRAWLAMTGLFARMLRIMGPAWVGAYLESLYRGIGARGKQSAEELAEAVAQRDLLGLRRLFSPGAMIELGERRVTPDGLLDALPAPCRLHIEAPVSAAWATAFRFRIEGAAPAEGLCLLEFDPRVGRIESARFFPA